MAKKSSKSDPSDGRSGKALVIVESPAKAKTINKYLGSSYVVKASKGHVRDLPERQYGIDPGRNFEPSYQILPSHQKIVDDLRKEAADAETVYLATDLDREGEAIAWHLAQALDLPPEKSHRVIFNEITKSAIIEAFKHPHKIDQSKVDAQQARRILDRVVGYELSPLLWKKISKGLSAGRVQSVAVRLIVDREHEIRAFVPEEYWQIDGVFTTDVAKAVALAEQWKQFDAPTDKGDDGPSSKARMEWLAAHNSFEAQLHQVKSVAYKPMGRHDAGKPREQAFDSAAGEVRPLAEALGFRVEEIIETPWKEYYERLGLRQVRFVGRMDPAKAPEFTVTSIETKRTKSRPSAPFTTASLQQASSNTLGFDTSRTMRIAQGLYEGVDIGTGEGNVGLITYMRTDSTHLSGDSIKAVRGLIGQSFGDKYLPEGPNYYSSSNKQAQEAHEAIRPTDPTRTPQSLRGHLNPDQYKLYDLIWTRFVACQMTSAEWDSTTVLISAKTPQGEAVFKANGRVLVFDGFYKVAGVPKSSEDQLLPALKEGQKLGPVAIEPSQKFTSPPPRFNEASLVKTLESEGIGRPSTYAAIIKTIQDRGYAEQVNRRFHATARGEVVTAKLIEHFPKIMDVGFTSRIEGELDKIEECQMEWHEVLHDFYDPFKESLNRANSEMEAVRAQPSEYTCEKCGKPMVYRLGKNGRFLSCTGYPECTNAQNVDRDGKIVAAVKVDAKCPKCGKDMALRRSKMGPFLGCTGYPDCESTMPCDEAGVPLKRVKAEDVKEQCPDCGGPMEVKFARGRSFMGCKNYPTCKATKPVPPGIHIEKPPPEQAGARCDKCGRGMVIRKSRRGPFLSCSGFPRCRNAMPMEKLDELKRKEAAGEIPEAPPNDEKKTKVKGKAARTSARAGGAKGKAAASVNVAELGPPPPGFAWTRTGRPVVETWPDGPLTCPNCSGSMNIRTGRFGPFFSCDKCRNAVNLRGEAKKRAETEMPSPDRPKPIETEVACPDCGSKMMLRMGRTGRFLGCSGYPKCKKTMEVPPGLLREVGAEAAGV